MSYFVYWVLKFKTLVMKCYNAHYHYIDRKNYFIYTTMSNSIYSKTSVEQDDVVLIYACAKKTFGFDA